MPGVRKENTMYKIANFSSLWEIGFAVNAIFVFFELQPVLEEKFRGIQSIGSDIIKMYVRVEDQRYILTYGWKSIAFGYVIWLGRLKLYSIFCSLSSIFLIIIGGFNPDFSFGFIEICVSIVLIFLPVIAILSIILYFLPKYKIKCIHEATSKLIEKYQNDQSFKTNYLNKYKHLADFIEFLRNPALTFFKSKKKKTFTELFEIFNE